MNDARENGFWKVCEALDCELRLLLIRYLLSVETAEFPCVNELAETFDVTSAAMSIHLKKLARVGLVASKRADRRVYYRAFATSAEGERVIAALRDFFVLQPGEDRIRSLLDYIHALSHSRRHAIVRALNAEPELDLKTLSMRTEMPPQTADRLCGDLGKARIVDLHGRVFKPAGDPEATLLELTLA